MAATQLLHFPEAVPTLRLGNYSIYFFVSSISVHHRHHRPRRNPRLGNVSILIVAAHNQSVRCQAESFSQPDLISAARDDNSGLVLLLRPVQQPALWYGNDEEAVFAIIS